MKFDPQTEEQIQTAMLLPEGIYSYRVEKSEERISQTGNDYISLILKVKDDEGKEHPVFTNLSLIKLLKHFCDVNGLHEEYKSGELEAHKCQNKNSGQVVIGIDPEKPNPNGGFYKAKNIVKDYVSLEHKGSLTKPLDHPFDDSVPF